MSAPPAFDSHRRPKWPSVTLSVVVIHLPVLVPEIERVGAEKLGVLEGGGPS